MRYEPIRKAKDRTPGSREMLIEQHARNLMWTFAEKLLDNFELVGPPKEPSFNAKLIVPEYSPPFRVRTRMAVLRYVTQVLVGLTSKKITSFAKSIVLLSVVTLLISIGFKDFLQDMPGFLSWVAVPLKFFGIDFSSESPQIFGVLITPTVSTVIIALSGFYVLGFVFYQYLKNRGLLDWLPKFTDQIVMRSLVFRERLMFRNALLYQVMGTDFGVSPWDAPAIPEFGLRSSSRELMEEGLFPDLDEQGSEEFEQAINDELELIFRSIRSTGHIHRRFEAAMSDYEDLKEVHPDMRLESFFLYILKEYADADPIGWEKLLRKWNSQIVWENAKWTLRRGMRFGGLASARPTRVHADRFMEIANMVVSLQTLPALKKIVQEKVSKEVLKKWFAGKRMATDEHMALAEQMERRLLGDEYLDFLIQFNEKIIDSLRHESGDNHRLIGIGLEAYYLIGGYHRFAELKRHVDEKKSISVVRRDILSQTAKSLWIKTLREAKAEAADYGLDQDQVERWIDTLEKARKPFRSTAEDVVETIGEADDFYTTARQEEVDSIVTKKTTAQGVEESDLAIPTPNIMQAFHVVKRRHPELALTLSKPVHQKYLATLGPEHGGFQSTFGTPSYKESRMVDGLMIEADGELGMTPVDPNKTTRAEFLRRIKIIMNSLKSLQEKRLQKYKDSSRPFRHSLNTQNGNNRA